MFEDPQILGKLYGYLITHRILRTRVGENEKFFPEEKELAQAYKSMDKRSKIAFEEFLTGSGFKLIRYDAFSYPGLPQGSTCYVLIRNSMEHVPQWLKPAHIYDAVIARKGHKNNTQRVLRLWFFIIWLNLLALLYKGNRPLSAVSDAGKMSFTDDILLKQISDFIELEIRQKSDADAYDQFIREVLLEDNPRDLRRRVMGFLEFMTQISYLTRYTFEGSIVYTQTLVMASEVASNYADCFAYLINEYDDDGLPFGVVNDHDLRDPDAKADTSQITQVLKDRYFEGYPDEEGIEREDKSARREGRVRADSLDGEAEWNGKAEGDGEGEWGDEATSEKGGDEKKGVQQTLFGDDEENAMGYEPGDGERRQTKGERLEGSENRKRDADGEGEGS